MITEFEIFMKMWPYTSVISINVFYHHCCNTFFLGVIIAAADCGLREPRDSYCYILWVNDNRVSLVSVQYYNLLYI